MTGRSKMSVAEMFGATPISTILPGLESGRTHSDRPDGQTIEKSGAAPRRANRSVSPDGKKERMIRGICGPTFFDSSMPVDPPDSLANRLVVRLGMIGSTESSLIWKAKTTPAGRTIFRLAPLMRRTSETDCTGMRNTWPTPTTFERMSERAKFNRPTSGPSRGGCTMGLGDVMELANWSTPRSSDGEKGGPNQNFGAGGQPLPAQMHQATWPKTDLRSTWPTKADADGGHLSRSGGRSNELLLKGMLKANWRTPQNRKTAGGSYSDPAAAAARITSGHQVNLEDQMVAQWATPTTRDFRSGKASDATHARNARPLNEQMTPPSGTTPSGSYATTEKRGVPNPVFPCWLQGLPEEYLCGGRWVTPSARRSRSK